MLCKFIISVNSNIYIYIPYTPINVSSVTIIGSHSLALTQAFQFRYLIFSQTRAPLIRSWPVVLPIDNRSQH